MKKLTEELRNLDIENEYNVPEDFRENVMKKVNKEVKIYNTKYVIATLSMAAIVILGFFVAGNNQKMMNMRNKDTQSSMVTQDDAMFDMVEITTNTAEEYKTALKESAIASTVNRDVKYDYDNAINIKSLATLFEDANIEIEKNDDYIKAKCSKEKAQEILEGYDVSIEEDGEYVIIK